MDKDIIVMEWYVKGELHSSLEWSRETFDKKSGVITLLDLDPNSIIIIDKPVLLSTIKYFFKPL